MICRIHGTLENVVDARAEVSLGNGVTYELLLPAFAASRLGGLLDQPVTLHTVHYLEGNATSSVMTPRLAGFLTEDDRAFFGLFTSVKGIGPRKALRAMAMATHQIAAAIADRDAKTLQALPEVGKRTAETIIVDLSGKMDRFLGAHESAASHETGAIGPATRSAAREAIEVLVQLGENRTQAIRMVDEIAVKDPSLDDTESLVAAALAGKAGA